MQAPRMKVGVYGDSISTSLPQMLTEVGHDVYYMDYHPTPPEFADLDMVVLDLRGSLLEPAVEKLAEQARRGQIFVHTSLGHGVQIMDPLEVTGAIVIALGELSPTRWALTTLDDLGDTIAELLLGECGANVVRCTDHERVRLAAAVTYLDAVQHLEREARRDLDDLVGEHTESHDIPGTRRWTPLPDVLTLRRQWQSIEDPGHARSFRQVLRRVAETTRKEDIELWAIQEEKL